MRPLIEDVDEMAHQQPGRSQWKGSEKPSLEDSGTPSV